MHDYVNEHWFFIYMARVALQRHLSINVDLSNPPLRGDAALNSIKNTSVMKSFTILEIPYLQIDFTKLNVLEVVHRQKLT